MLHFDYIQRHFSQPREMGHTVNVFLDEVVNHDAGATADIAGFLLEEHNFQPSQALTVDAMVKYGYYGQQTFQIGPELQEMFRQTSLKSVPREALLLPYPAFYLDLPNCPWKVWGGSRTQWHNVKGAYVMLKGDYLCLVVWGGENDKSMGPGDDATVWAKISLNECFNDHGDIEKYLDWLFDPNQGARMNNDALVEGTPDMTTHMEQKESHINLFRVAVNLALYLQTETPEVTKVTNDRAAELAKKLERAKNPGKKKKIQRQLVKLSKATVVKIGQSIEEKMSKLRASPSVKRAQWVRGHWHRYWTGKGRSKLVPRWIHPYPRNLDAEAVVEKRRYEIEPSPDAF
jgi:hypothetical protein